MKALSVKQPWAELIASGVKTIELRSWSRAHRGELVIVSGLRFDERGARWQVDGPRGVVVAQVELVDIRRAREEDSDAACFPVDANDERLMAWVLANPRRLEPTKVKGVLGLFNIELPTLASAP